MQTSDTGGGDDDRKQQDSSALTAALALLNQTEMSHAEAHGHFALHMACAQGHTELVRLLIQNGTDINVQDRWGNVPMQKALLHGHKEIVELLQSHGAVISDNYKKEMEMKLFYLAASGDLVGTQKLVEVGININSTDYNERTALHIASEKGSTEVVEYLIAQNANVNCKDNSGNTPLMLAIKNKHASVQEALTKAGAFPLDTSLVKCKRAIHANASFAVMEAFPRPIAIAMLEGRKIEPISKERVSLFFSDIVDFTSISSTMDPAKVSQMLNTLFRKFDRLAYFHGVQKIDVIGDAYIAATNFIEEQEDDHAARIARFAVDAMKVARETRIYEEDEDAGLLGGGLEGTATPLASNSVQLRIGIHCGPVSGSVVGAQNLKYTLMGDTVNIASRMESTGLAGRIQCSQASADYIARQAHEMVLKPRAGGVDVKGKGVMQTFWVSSLRQGRRTLGSCPDLSLLPGWWGDVTAAAAAAGMVVGGCARGGGSAPTGGGHRHSPVAEERVSSSTGSIVDDTQDEEAGGAGRPHWSSAAGAPVGPGAGLGCGAAAARRRRPSVAEDAIGWVSSPSLGRVACDGFFDRCGSGSPFSRSSESLFSRTSSAVSGPLSRRGSSGALSAASGGAFSRAGSTAPSRAESSAFSRVGSTFSRAGSVAFSRAGSVAFSRADSFSSHATGPASGPMSRASSTASWPVSRAGSPSGRRGSNSGAGLALGPGSPITLPHGRGFNGSPMAAGRPCPPAAGLDGMQGMLGRHRSSGALMTPGAAVRAGALAAAEYASGTSGRLAGGASHLNRGHSVGVLLPGPGPPQPHTGCAARGRSGGGDAAAGPSDDASHATAGDDKWCEAGMSSPLMEFMPPICLPAACDRPRVSAAAKACERLAAAVAAAGGGEKESAESECDKAAGDKKASVPQPLARVRSGSACWAVEEGLAGLGLEGPDEEPVPVVGTASDNAALFGRSASAAGAAEAAAGSNTSAAGPRSPLSRLRSWSDKAPSPVPPPASFLTVAASAPAPCVTAAAAAAAVGPAGASAPAE